MRSSTGNPTTSWLHHHHWLHSALNFVRYYSRCCQFIDAFIIGHSKMTQGIHKWTQTWSKDVNHASHELCHHWNLEIEKWGTWTQHRCEMRHIWWNSTRRNNKFSLLDDVFIKKDAVWKQGITNNHQLLIAKWGPTDTNRRDQITSTCNNLTCHNDETAFDTTASTGSSKLIIMWFCKRRRNQGKESKTSSKKCTRWWAEMEILAQFLQKAKRCSLCKNHCMTW